MKGEGPPAILLSQVDFFLGFCPRWRGGKWGRVQAGGNGFSVVYRPKENILIHLRFFLERSVYLRRAILEDSAMLVSFLPPNLPLSSPLYRQAVSVAIVLSLFPSLNSFPHSSSFPSP